MHVGLVIFATDYAIRIDDLAREAEQRGFESLFVTEHTHIPVSRRTPWPGGRELPREYWHTVDPFVGLSAAASVTRSLKIGTGVCLVPEHDPISLAKEVATLDFLSGGRFIFGVGAGWNREEMENHGTEYSTRFRVMEDRVRAMQAIWTQDEAAYEGEFVRFEPIWSYPKPVQKPHPPILWGGESRHTLRRVVELGTGWIPRARAGGVVEGMAELRQLAQEAGKSPSALSVTVYGARPDRATLEGYAEAGVDRVLFVLPSEDREATLPRLDEYAPLASAFGGETG